jgi:UDP-N-acetylmuramoyl-L-alanyl-D-glutamate--2,6-diaminopimelate ligase
MDPLAISGNCELTSIIQDSRLATPGCLFVCNPGTTSDSHAYLPDAKSKGAAAAVVWSDEGFESAKGLGMAAFQLSEDRIAFNDAVCRLCNTFFGYPTRSMMVVGVTGTNGKTTTAWLIRDMLAALGLKAAYLGTLGFQLPGEERELGNTTPFPVELWTLLAEARDKGVEAIAIEVSSHALAEHRCEYVEFDAGVFTNLTQDHLDFHGSMEAYEAAKLRLFTELPKQTSKRFWAVLNTDDPVGVDWDDSLEGPRWRFGVVSSFDGLEMTPARYDVRAFAHEIAVDHIDLELTDFGSPNPSFRCGLGGSYNVENLVASISAMVVLGFKLDDACRAAEMVRPVPGRFEAVPNDQGIGILVDYAHTPDALEKLLDAVRPLTQGRVITVFGCGGDRDRNKRPKMAKAASERSDVTVVTSDNPRTEDPQAILNEVLAGIVPGRESVDIIDRREAIAHAVKIALPGDVVVIAGKGHENYQIIGRTKHPMDDRELAREALSARRTLWNRGK